MVTEYSSNGSKIQFCSLSRPHKQCRSVSHTYVIQDMHNARVIDRFKWRFSLPSHLSGTVDALQYMPFNQNLAIVDNRDISFTPMCFFDTPRFICNLPSSWWKLGKNFCSRAQSFRVIFCMPGKLKSIVYRKRSLHHSKPNSSTFGNKLRVRIAYKLQCI